MSFSVKFLHQFCYHSLFHGSITYIYIFFNIYTLSCYVDKINCIKKNDTGLCRS